MQQSPTYVEHIEQAQERLERLLRDHQAEDPFAPVTVVVPTTYAGLYLRRDIGRRGLVNVRFLPLARVAELLGAPSLAANGQRPLKPPIEFAAVRRAASQAAGELEPFRAHPSFHASLRSTFRDLRRAAPDAITALERRRGMSGEIARLYARYCEHTKAYYDREALAESAADCSENRPRRHCSHRARPCCRLPAAHPDALRAALVRRPARRMEMRDDPGRHRR